MGMYENSLKDLRTASQLDPANEAVKKAKLSLKQRQSQLSLITQELTPSRLGATSSLKKRRNRAESFASDDSSLDGDQEINLISMDFSEASPGTGAPSPLKTDRTDETLRAI
mmetsp:Transcript_5089/g.7737  ORF Transcript_5089/g.7737 Transcript_5089/m.7737 type:complete len:112 (-) Transcript_5089:174-509(-)